MDTKERCTQLRAFKGAIWCDDHVDLWIGDCDELQRQLATQDFDNVVGLEPAEGKCCDFLYFVCWSNDSGQNGLLVELAGTNPVLSGDNSGWEVFPTGIDYDAGSPRPSKALIEQQIALATCEKGWKPVAVGEKNNSNKGLFPIKPGINNNANFIWCDSTNDPSPGAPFTGFNHDEFLIFRLPVSAMFRKECVECPCPKCKCDCGCGCEGCNEDAADQNLELIYRALDKTNTVPATGSKCGPPFSKDCERSLINPKVDVTPCFYFHWGDGGNDQIEEHDTEVCYITVCNPFRDVAYRGFKITKVTLVPNQPLDKVQIVPDRLICIDCLEACTCQTREFALITRANDTAGNYQLEVEYCFESLEVNLPEKKTGKVDFPITITED